MNADEQLRHGSVKREVLNLEKVGDDFVAEVIVIDGDKLTKVITDLGRDLGAVGDELSLSKYLKALEIPTDETGEIWLIKKAGLTCSILTNSQAESLGAEPHKGSRVGVIENVEKNKRLFFEIPELDVAQFFPKMVSSGDVPDETSKNISDNKDKIFGEYQMDGDEYMALCRQIYGVWKKAEGTGELEALDAVMDELYPNAIPEKNYDTLEALAILVSTDLQQEEVDYPAKNWWKARSVVNRVIEIVGTNSSYDSDFKKAIEIVNLISDRSSFYPDQMWQFIVKPLMKLYCTGGGYDRQGFIRQVVGDVDSVTSPHLLLGLDEVRRIYDGADS